MRDRRRHPHDREEERGIPDGLLLGLLGFLLGLTLLVWTATGLAGVLVHGSWPTGVTFGNTPLAMRALASQPQDLPAAWPNTPAAELSGYGLFWGLAIGELMVLTVLTIFVLGTLSRWRAVRANRREQEREQEEASGARGAGRGDRGGRTDGSRTDRKGGSRTGRKGRTSAPGAASAATGSSAASDAADRETRRDEWDFPPERTAGPSSETAHTETAHTPRRGADRAAGAAHGAADADGLAQPGGWEHPAEGSGAPAGPPHTGASAHEAAGREHPATPDGAPAKTPHAAPTRHAQQETAAWDAVANPLGGTGSPLGGADSPLGGASPLPSPRTPRLLFGAPATRKPTTLRAVLDADGPALVVTSDPTVWAETKDARAKLGPVLVYDPGHLCDTPGRLHWSPTARCEDPAIAQERAAALLAPVRPRALLDAAMADTAETLLRCWLHAAAVDGRQFKQLLRWAQGTGAHEAVRILRTHPKAVHSLAGLLESALTAHPERREIAQQLVARALASLSSIHIREACTPNRADSLALESFIDEGGTLYVVGEPIEDPRTHPGAMPLLTALASDVVEHGRRMAARSSAGRLDPPLTLVLDDVAAVAPLPRLPELLAAGQDHGLPTLVLLRSAEQARSRWTDALTQ
ncbi:type VI secretion protein [Streptomyces sp. NPDC051907]|uniref:type VI secretion protein n=1 Tax=Streptomyces sp. NPDC051907 TaxID=3155284 RepID=UPI00342A1DB1